MARTRLPKIRQKKIFFKSQKSTLSSSDGLSLFIQANYELVAVDSLVFQNNEHAKQIWLGNLRWATAYGEGH